jgi:hypothetical protein
MHTVPFSMSVNIAYECDECQWEESAGIDDSHPYHGPETHDTSEHAFIIDGGL